MPDAIIIGSGPNGLAAAVTLARAGLRVIVYEGSDRVGGGTRTEELTLPGFVHDICSAVHPLAHASPFFRELALARHGLEWIHPPAPLAHPLDDGSAVVLHRSIDDTAREVGADGCAYANMMAPLVASWDRLVRDLLAPLHVPTHPFALARFGVRAMTSARWLASWSFTGERARALFAGLAAHAMLPLEAPLSSAVALVLSAAGHAGGWPIARGGSERIADALAAEFRSLGGAIVTSRWIASLDEVPAARAVLCDVTPRQLLAIAGARLPVRYRRVLARYRYGMGAFKIDWALDGPIPWTAGDCARAATVHVGGTLDEIAAAEAATWRGEPTDRPFVLLAQPSVFDPTRAPAGRHTAWGYCHVPHGSTGDMTAAIERQIERFAPGFRERILARRIRPPLALERDNPNLIGGDINGGVLDLRQLVCRPTLRPYATPIPGVYLCSSSTPPGGGVHGMCGYHAARAALRYLSAHGA